MQTIWTRVAQVRASCHCPQCMPSTSAVARRATATATRRAPRFWTSSTVWYSGIFAVAATLDLGVKQQRRDQWNKAIERAKQDLARSDDADANRHFLNSLEEESVASQEMRENLDSSPLRSHMPEWPSSTGQERWSSKLPPQSIYTDNQKKAKHLLDRWYPKKMERIQLSIDALQLGFFMELHRHGWHEEAASAVPVWYAEHILQPAEDTREILIQKHLDLQRIVVLKDKYSFGGEDEQAGLAEFARWQRSEGDVRLCDYVQDDLGSFHSVAYELNTTLRNLFDMGRKCMLSRPAVLAKVYHNLSVSSAAPNIDTFNTLIIGLSDIGTRRLVEDCIDALQCAMVRHNEVSLASILNYFTLTGNEDEFQLWIQLMGGEWGGLALAQPGVQITIASQGRLMRKIEEGVKIIQRPCPTPMVFNALVNGVIKFSGFDAALRVCEAARDEGWGLCINGFHSLLKDCSRRRDWDAGLATWTQIQALMTATEEKSGDFTRKDPIINLSTFASMLQLCTRCNNRTAFQDVMEQAIAAYPKSATDLVRMVRMERSEMKTSDQDFQSAAGDLTLLSDIPLWLTKQNLSQYHYKLDSIPWQDMVRLDDKELEMMGVSLNSVKNKLLNIFEQVRTVLPYHADSAKCWLKTAVTRRLRKNVLEARNIAWCSIELERPESRGEDSALQQDLYNPQALQDEMQHLQALDSPDELVQQASFAFDVASIPDQLESTYQPQSPHEPESPHEVKSPYQPFGQ